ncbi:STAS domain-containing protein [Streptomyces sp. NPDC050625]|uniref:STAS domain-containing protein n=1 Tax=Streptomyces sp. NPDC050625 TaxID=3154629 RepID=UPI0034321615
MRHPLHRFRRRGHITTSSPDHVFLRLSGEITSRNAGLVGDRLRDVLRSRPKVLEMDLGNVSHLSSDGDAVFFMALRTARLYGMRVVVTHTPPQAHRTLSRLGLERVLPLYEGDGPFGSGGGDQ